jgi:hypothetical protein
MTPDTEELLSDYKKHLSVAFHYISQDPMIKHVRPEISDSSEKIFSKLKSCNSSSTWAFTIDPPWIVQIRKDRYFGDCDASLAIGGEMRVVNSAFDRYNFYVSIIRNYWGPKNLTVYDSCCEANCRGINRIVRRFHFDTDGGIKDTLETKSHVQFGGICHEETAIREQIGKSVHYCLDNKLDIPRLPYPPIDIILLFDILIRQFETEINKDFVGKSEWIHIVRTTEDFRLKNYYREISNYYQKKETGRADSRKTLFETMCDEDFCF